MVLHTWGQRLQHHPHVHCVVPAGGLVTGWRTLDPRAPDLLPAHPGAAAGLSRETRGRPARGVSRRAGCSFRARCSRSPRRPPFARFSDRSIDRRWVVYAKPPFGSPAHVLHYLARYTHRVAISNHRLVAVTDDTVSFRWKDYRHGSQIRTLTLEADEFLRRFLLHVLPKRFVRIRYFGVLAAAVPHPRRWRSAGRPWPSIRRPHRPTRPSPRAPRRTWPCPRCGAPMRVVERLTARQLFLETVIDGLVYDTLVARRARPARPTTTPRARAIAGGVPARRDPPDAPAQPVPRDPADPA